MHKETESAKETSNSTLESFFDAVTTWEGNAIAQKTRELLFGNPRLSAFRAIMEARHLHHEDSLRAGREMLAEKCDSQRA